MSRKVTKRQVVVIGSGLGGLSAAIHARLRGHDVLVLEAGSTLGGKAASIELDGFRLDPGPSIVILLKIYEQLFAAAGKRLSDYLRFTRLDPISRVMYDTDEVLDLPSSRSECLRVLNEVAPEDSAQFKKLFSKLDSVSPLIDKSIFAHAYDQPLSLADPRLLAIGARFDVRKTYKELVDGMFSSDLLRAFFYGFPSYGGQSYNSKAAGALLIPYLMIEEGVYYPTGGVGAIPRAFEQLARELGVEFQTQATVTGLAIDGKRIVGVRLSSSETIAADSVISNVDRTTTGKWLGRFGAVRPSYSYFTVHWGLRKKLANLAHHTLIVPNSFEKGFSDLYDHRAFPNPPVVYLNETTSTDPSVAPSGCTNLFAVVTSPAMEPDIDWELETPKFKGAVVNQLKEFGIEWEDRDLVFERIQTPKYFESVHGNHLGSLYGPQESDRLFGGLFPLRNWDEEYKDLYYCGGSVQPGAGMPMVTLSGKFAVDAMESHRR